MCHAVRHHPGHAARLSCYACILIPLSWYLHWQPRYLFPFQLPPCLKAFLNSGHRSRPFLRTARFSIKYWLVTNAQFSVALPVRLSYILRADFLRLVPLNRHNNEGRELFWASGLSALVEN